MIFFINHNIFDITIGNSKQIAPQTLCLMVIKEFIMRKTLAILVVGTLPLFAEPVCFGVQNDLVIRSKDAGKHRSWLQIGGHARWNFRSGCSALLRLDLSRHKPVLSANCLFHAEPQLAGPYSLVGIGTSGVECGVGYDFDQRFGMQARFTSNHNTISAGVTYRF